MGEQRSAAERLLDQALSEPRVALDAGQALLEEIDEKDHETKATVLRGLALAARLAGTIEESAAFGRRSVAEAENANNPTLRSEALMTLSGSLAIAGDNASALSVLESAYQGSSGRLEAAISSQEGAIRQRLGEARLAMECYARALPVFRAAGDLTSVALTMNNMAMLRIRNGDLKGAKRDLHEASAIDLDLGHRSAAAGADHNLGLLAAYQGDIPEALELFDHSERLVTELFGSAAEVQVSRVEVLLSAGLFREALALAVDISATLQKAGLGEDEAEARLVGAQAALLAGDVELALRWADIAAELFEKQHRMVWAANARLVGIQAQYQANAINPALIVEAKDITAILEGEGQVIPAFNARLTAGRIGLELGLVDEAIEDLQRVAEQRNGPVEVRLQSWLAKALIRLATGNPAGADAAARAGMRLLDDYQAALGATDIRTGVERHGAELGELGLRLALESAHPRRVLAWMERTRARALRHRPVTPSDHHAQAVDLAELRRISVEMRSADAGGARELSRQERALQESIRNRGRVTRAQSSGGENVFPEIASSLRNRTLIEFASLDDRLWSVTIKEGRFSLAELGPETAVLNELESLRFTMRRLARGRGNASTDLARQIAARLDEMLFGGLDTGTGAVVVVPTPALHSTPWAALPTCRGRPVTTAPSAELWWRASRRRRGPGAVVVVAGPDLASAGTEASEVAALYHDALLIGPENSTVEKVRTALNRAAMGHLASHASFEVENPMFSSLRFADGDLTVYDMERMRRVPHLVVLSACDSGFSDTLPGEELMGLSSALLSMGARSLIASVGLVPDSDATRALMVELHRNLIARIPPAEALGRAQLAIADVPGGYVAAASFVCIGAG
ncbi:MAG TPA: CHAT domain-containing protein [Acidimicrobiia bacterium]|nr:CHAT domain-containing protein [Acidimicrobiia bacterium]